MVTVLDLYEEVILLLLVSYIMIMSAQASNTFK